MSASMLGIIISLVALVLSVGSAAYSYGVSRGIEQRGVSANDCKGHPGCKELNAAKSKNGRLKYALVTIRGWRELGDVPDDTNPLLYRIRQIEEICDEALS